MGDEALEKLAAPLASQVQGDTPLAAVVHGEVAGPVPGLVAGVVIRHDEATGHVEPLSRLHLDHVSPQLGQDAGAGRPGEDLREVQHPDTVKR
jgi:hypothetical protein